MLPKSGKSFGVGNTIVIITMVIHYDDYDTLVIITMVFSENLGLPKFNLVLYDLNMYSFFLVKLTSVRMFDPR